MVVGVFVIGSCGSGAEDTGPSASVDPSPTTNANPESIDAVATVQKAAEATVARLGDDDMATAATFLAIDAGYDLGQLVDAGPAGRLLLNGEIVTDDGSPVAPANAPTGLILDDVTADYQVAGFSPIPDRPLSALMVRFEEAAEPPGKEAVYQRLFILMALIQQGYTLEQIMTGLFTLGGISEWFELTEADGTVVEPAQAPYESLQLYDDDYERAYATTSTSTPPTSEGPVADEEQQIAELVERAVGVYSIAPDLGAHLQGLGDVISVVPPDGEFVVAEDGTISGSFIYTIVQGADDFRLTSKWDRTLVEAPLTVLDDGLTFAAPMDLIITWDGGDTQPFVEEVTGILDVDIGQLVVTGFTELDSVRFER